VPKPRAAVARAATNAWASFKRLFFMEFPLSTADG
jgi:hypothetical protein